VRGVPLWRLAGLTAGVLVLTGCRYLGPTSSEVKTYTLSDSITSVSVDNKSGTVEVTAGSGPVQVTETLTYSNGKPNTSHAVDAGKLNLVDNGCSGNVHRCEVSYVVRVPAATAVQIQASAGKVTLTGLAGDIDVTNSAGRIDGTDLTSQHTVVKDNAGEISLAYTAVPASVEARDSAGRIEIKVPGTASYAVDAHTSAGKTEVSVPQDSSSAHKIYARDTAGAIEISVLG
jgi:DUF4097 and DUF4098 domain-containing protein YvlB